MVKVSVIVPVYNTEKYLPKCLDSLTAQTLQDIEIICINDCSPDNSLQILQNYAANDKRIKIIDFKENQGAAVARNIGIDAATGDYIGFVDSDDYVDVDFYEKLYTKAQETNADIVKGVYYHLPDRCIVSRVNQKIKEDKNNFVCDYCSAIFKKVLISKNNIKFPKLCDMEDPVFAFKCAVKANKILTEDSAIINIVHHSHSQTARPMTCERLMDKLEGFSKILEIANLNNLKPETYGYICALWFNGLFYNIENLTLEDKIILRNFVKNFYQKIEHKQEFLAYLKVCSYSLYSMLLKNDFENLFNCKKNDLIIQQETIIKQLQKSFDLYETKLNQVLQTYLPVNLGNKRIDDIYFVSVVNDYKMYERCISKNPYVTHNTNIKLIDFDNTKENITLSKRYNSFLQNYNFNKNAWFIFCHCDWELMEDINKKLVGLDKNCIYGPVGSKTVNFDKKVGRLPTGFCYERKKNGSGFRNLGMQKNEVEISDTFDCQCIIVHSSLIQKYNLKFDENLDWDLYVEDFSINAHKNYNINSYTLCIDACHWSGYHDYIPPSYYKSLEYLKKKYPNDLYSGTVSFIGGKPYEEMLMTKKELVLFYVRDRLKKAIK